MLKKLSGIISRMVGSSSSSLVPPSVVWTVWTPIAPVSSSVSSSSSKPPFVPDVEKLRRIASFLNGIIPPTRGQLWTFSEESQVVSCWSPPCRRLYQGKEGLIILGPEEYDKHIKNPFGPEAILAGFSEDLISLYKSNLIERRNNFDPARRYTLESPVILEALYTLADQWTYNRNMVRIYNNNIDRIRYAATGTFESKIPIKTVGLFFGTFVDPRTAISLAQTNRAGAEGAEKGKQLDDDRKERNMLS
jgi:hypothetical protein